MLKYEPSVHARKHDVVGFKKTNGQNSLATAQSDQLIRYSFSAKFDS